MKTNSLQDRLRIILSDAMLERIDIQTTAAQEIRFIVIDVHGLTCKEANRLINNIVIISKGTCAIEVIHGYRHGTKIKDMLRAKKHNTYIKTVVADSFNLGVTYLNLV